MQTLRQSTILGVLLMLFILSSTIFANPPRQAGATIITPENAYQVAELGSYGEGLVVDLALSPDNDLLAVATTVNVIILDIETSETMMVLDGNTNILTMIDWSKDGRYIATASEDQVVRVYAVETGTLMHEFGDFGDEIEFVTFSPDSAYLLAGGARRDHTMRLYDVATGNVVWTLDLNSEFVLDAIFSPDGESIIGSVSDYSATIWNTQTGEMERSFGIDAFSDQIMLSADSQRLLVRDSTQLLSAFDFSSGDLLWKTEREAGSIYAIGLVGATNTLLAGTRDGLIQQLAIDTGEVLDEFGDLVLGTHSIIASSNEQRIYAASNAVGVQGYDLESRELVASFERFTNYKGHLPFDRDNASYFEQEGTQLAEYSVATGELLGYLPNVVIPEGSFANVLPDQETILVETRIEVGDSADLSQFVVVDRSTGDTILEFAPSDFHEVVLASPNAQFFAVALQDRSIEVWDTETGDMTILPNDGNGGEGDAPVFGQVLWSPDSQQLLVGYFGDATIVLWDIVSGTIVRNYDDLFENTSFIWWQDGDLVGIRINGNSLRLWKVDSGDVVLEITINEAISSLAVSPNFDLVALGTQLGNIMLIDMATGDVFNTLPAQIGPAFAAWSYDGALIRSSGYDYVIHLWGIPME